MGAGAAMLCAIVKRKNFSSITESMLFIEHYLCMHILIIKGKHFNIECINEGIIVYGICITGNQGFIRKK